MAMRDQRAKTCVLKKEKLESEVEVGGCEEEKAGGDSLI